MRWYFDFISPYAYLQSTRLDELATIEPVRCVPVLFAGLLGHWGHTGPAELAPKRRWTFEHVTWLAHRDGIRLRLPDHHPFNPLPLLRLSEVLGNTPQAVRRLFAFVWEEGHVPQDARAFDALLAELGVGSAALATDSVRQAIRANTDAAIGDGVFGVPTMVWDACNFWGYDATDMILARAAAAGNDDAYPARAIAAAQALARGPGRRASTAPAADADGPETHAQVDEKPRIAYLPHDLAEPAGLVAAIRARRGGGLIELDRLLLYSPPLASGWNQFLGTIRTGLAVPAKLRELIMCTVAVINGASYEFFQHAPLLLAAGGTQAQVQALRDPDAAARNRDLFTETECALLSLCIAMTREVKVDDDTFRRVRACLAERELIESIATVGAYNMVSRFLVALNVHPQTASEAGPS